MIHIKLVETEIIMARVQLIIPDQDRERFARQAKREGMTFSAWLRAAAQARVEEQQQRFSFPVELEEFFPPVRYLGRP